jgi:hypothetical protein
MPCQRVLAPMSGTGPPQAAETAVTARASEHGKLPAVMLWDLPAHAVAHGHQSWVGDLAASAPIDSAHAVLQDRGREAVHNRLVMHGSPQMVRARLQHVLANTGALVRDGACSITPVAGEAHIGGCSRSRGPPARRSDERCGGGGAQFADTAAVSAAEKRRPQFPRMGRVCPRRGRPD